MFRLFSERPPWQLLAARSTLALFFVSLLACAGETGSAGAKGEAGATGATGAVGPQGPTGLKGDKGDKGDTGQTGTQGTKGDTGAAGAAGAAGAQGAKGDKGDKGEAGAKGDQGLPGVPGAQGPKGEPAPDPNNLAIPLDPSGLVGRVVDSAKQPVVGAKVLLIPAADISKQKLVVDSPMPKSIVLADAVADKADEPLEDLVDAQLLAPTYTTATTDANGAYDLKNVAAGSYFLFVQPDKADVERLPGGDQSRIAKESSALVGKRVDVKLSMSAVGATYVGSSLCITCHGKTAIKSTMHFMGIRQPGKNDGLQKLDAALWPNFDNALKYFDGKTTIYYYTSNPTAVPPSYATYLVKAGETQPDTAWINSKMPSFKLTMGMDSNGKLTATLENLKAAQAPATYTVQLSYGGGIYKQRYVVQINGTRHVLPIQVNSSGLHDNASTTPSDRREVIGYNTDRWYDEAKMLVKAPSDTKAFDNNCLPCHAVGSISKPTAVANVFKAELPSDPWGKFDYDNDGTEDSLNMGCETCHGPGSRHLTKQGGGWHIVTPQNLSPERESMICGQCHSRVNGAGAGKTEAPLDKNGMMAPAGIRRSEWLKNYVSVFDDGIHANASAAADGTFTSIGDGKHSVKHHQQYSDFIKSGHYRNSKRILVCADCHSPHGATNNVQLKHDPATTDGCTSCHTAYKADVDLNAHVKAKTTMPTAAGAICTDCHMPKTALSGAGTKEAAGFYGNDITSHFFDVPKKALIKGIDPASPKGPLGKVMPIPYTNNCGAACHKFPVQ